MTKISFVANKITPTFSFYEEGGRENKNVQKNGKRLFETGSMPFCVQHLEYLQHKPSFGMCMITVSKGAGSHTVQKIGRDRIKELLMLALGE